MLVLVREPEPEQAQGPHMKAHTVQHKKVLELVLGPHTKALELELEPVLVQNTVLELVQHTKAPEQVLVQHRKVPEPVLELAPLQNTKELERHKERPPPEQPDLVLCT